jgi:hypothetical protein
MLSPGAPGPAQPGSGGYATTHSWFSIGAGKEGSGNMKIGIGLPNPVPNTEGETRFWWPKRQHRWTGSPPDG